MKSKYFIYVLIALIITVGLGGFANKSSLSPRLPRTLQTSTVPNTLGWYAQQAQAQGKTEYLFDAGIYEYLVPSTWDDVIASDFTFIVAEPTGSKSYPTPGANGTQDGIETWYRFKVDETLSSKPVPGSLHPAPNDAPPLQNNEIYIRKAGGSLSLNGIELTAVEPDFPVYRIGQKYLMILYYDPASKLGAIVMGSNGVYSVDSSGNLSSVSSNGSPYTDDIANRYNNNLNQLRAALIGR